MTVYNFDFKKKNRSFQEYAASTGWSSRTGPSLLPGGEDATRAMQGPGAALGGGTRSHMLQQRPKVLSVTAKTQRSQIDEK